MDITAKNARRRTDTYWDRVNLYTIVHEDIAKLELVIKAAAEAGYDHIKLNIDNAPHYVFTELHDPDRFTPHQLGVMKTRGEAYFDQLRFAGYRVTKYKGKWLADSYFTIGW